MFAHRQTQIDLRKSLGNVIESKKDIITKLRAKIVDQGEMCYEMLDEVNEHKRSAQLMKKHANEATKLSITRKRMKEVANVSVHCLQDQMALMQDEITGGNKNSRPVGFYSRNSTKSTVNPNTTIPQI